MKECLSGILFSTPGVVPWKQSNEEDSGSEQYYCCTEIQWEVKRRENCSAAGAPSLTEKSLRLFIGSGPFHTQISKASSQ